MAIERRTLKKAPTMDVVDAFTKDAAPTPQPAPRAMEPKAAAPVEPTIPAQRPAPDDSSVSESRVDYAEPTRRGPGRPRSKRRMESLATKIDIELRDQVDAYLATTGGTLVDLIDEAIRARLARK